MMHVSDKMDVTCIGAVGLCGLVCNHAINMPVCSAYGCNNSNVKNKDLSWFHFPLGKPELKRWIHNCGRDKWKPSKYSVLCSAHFKESSYKDDIYHRLMGQDPSIRRRRRLLKDGAVPTIFSHRPQSSKSRTFSVERAAKSERKKVRGYLLSFPCVICTI